MAVLMSLNGNAVGDGFLLAPLDSTYDAELLLWTDVGTAAVTLQASPNAANLVFSAAGVINLTTVPTSVSVHALLQSATRGDTTIQVLVGASVVTSFAVTSLRFPKVNFKGRFEARFATDGAYYNSNRSYTAVVDSLPNPAGWTWALEGEPDFVPAVNNVPENIEDTGLGRAIRLNNPVALRPHADPVTSNVNSITGETTSGVETFLVGDPVIGQPVNFGPDTYFSGNKPVKVGDPTPEEQFSDAQEPLALFKIDIGNPTMYFRGASRVGPFTHKFTFQGEHTRVPDSRPSVTSVSGAATEMNEFGIELSPSTFSATRIDLLLADYDVLPAGPSINRRNLVRRIGHLLGSATTTKKNAVQAAYPGVFITRAGSGPWATKLVYDGLVDTDLHAQANGSSVIEYLRQFFVFDINWTPFAFHSDELCGHHKGYLQGDPTMTGNSIGDPHTRTVDGTNYDFQSVGEFTLLRDGKKMEIQVRQSPVATQNPITDSYSGLTSCVSLITAVAVRLGNDVISLQPTGIEKGELQFYLNGKPSDIPSNGLNLSNNRITEFDSAGHQGIRIVTADNAVIVITPKFWNNHNVWYMNVNVANTRAVEGLMGYKPKRSWLPRLRNGESVGPMPNSLADRYVMLYKTFANSWRINSKSSLFVYARGTSTSTFTDFDWPADKVPCKVKPELENPGVGILKGMPIDEARAICKGVTDADLNASCVFDVASTGDKLFAETYLFEQSLRKCATSIILSGFVPPKFPARIETSEEINENAQSSFSLTATVKPLFDSKRKPKGTVIFYMNDKAISKPIELDPNGQAKFKVDNLSIGRHSFRADFVPSDKECITSSSSNLPHEVSKDEDNGNETNNNNTDTTPPKKGCLGTAVILMLILIWMVVM